MKDIDTGPLVALAIVGLVTVLVVGVAGLGAAIYFGGHWLGCW